jgi:cytochrome P450
MALQHELLPGILAVYFPPEYPAEKFLNARTASYFDASRQTWHFFSHQDVRTILTGPFEINYATPSPEWSWTYSALWSKEGEAHRIARSAEAHAYTPRAIESLQAQIAADARYLLARALAGADGRLEFARDFAGPLSIMAAARVMGLEAEVKADIPLLVSYMQANVQELQLANLHVLHGYQPLRDYLTSMLSQRALSPQEPPRLIDLLIADQSVSDLDLKGMVWSQMIEAPDTMASGLGFTLLAFLQFDLLDTLQGNRARLSGACDEALRLLPPFPAVFRQVKEDLTLGGCDLRQGQSVTGWISAANRDPAVFHNPHQFIVARETGDSLTFGDGQHTCLGKPLGQLVLPIAIGALLDASLPALRLGTGQQVERLLGINNTLLRLPLRYGQGEQDFLSLHVSTTQQA